MLLFYVRHGDPIYDPDMLTPLGKRQAESVAHRLALFGIDEIYSSTSVRAMQTARPLCEILNKELKTLDFLNEKYAMGTAIDYNGEKKWVWSHSIYSKVITRKDVRDMGSEWYNHPELKEFHFERCIGPIDEQLDEFLASHGYVHDVNKGLYKVTERNHEKRIAVFAHEGMGKIIMSHMLDIPYPYYAAHFEMKHTAVTVVRFDDGSTGTVCNASGEYARARLLTLSNDSHLYKDGLPLDYHIAQMVDRF